MPAPASSASAAFGEVRLILVRFCANHHEPLQEKAAPHGSRRAASGGYCRRGDHWPKIVDVIDTATGRVMHHGNVADEDLEAEGA
jgi:hypothetical protein